MTKQGEAVRVHGLRPDACVKAGHGLGVVVEDVGSRLDYGAHRVEVTLEVRREDLDRRARPSPPDGTDCPSENPRAAVPDVVPVDRRADRVFETELGHRFSDAQRLTEVEL